MTNLQYHGLQLSRASHRTAYVTSHRWKLLLPNLMTDSRVKCSGLHTRNALVFQKYFQSKLKSAPNFQSLRPMLKINPTKYLLLAVPVTTACLCIWQIYRRQWKVALIDRMAEQTSAAPVEFPSEITELKDMEYRKVAVKGKFDHSRETVLGPRVMLKRGDIRRETVFSSPSSLNSGWLVLTPFKLSDRDLTIIVNRGWVPHKKKKPHSRLQGQVEGEVEVVGILRGSEQKPFLVPENKPSIQEWNYRDIEELAIHLRTSPIYIDAVLDSSVQGGPVGGQTNITLRNEHATYIYIWLCLTLITSYMWYSNFVKVKKPYL